MKSNRLEISRLPGIGEGKRGVEGHIGYLLRQAFAAHRRMMEKALSDLGITPPQFSVLTMLVAYPGISGADLARLSLLTPQTMSLIVANLERMGAIQRRADPVHGRILHIEATASGKLLLSKCRRRVQVVERQLRNALGKTPETAVKAWLVAVALED